VILEKLTFPRLFKKFPTFVYVKSQITPFNAIPSYGLKIHFNIIILSTSRSSMCCFLHTSPSKSSMHLRDRSWKNLPNEELHDWYATSDIMKVTKSKGMIMPVYVLLCGKQKSIHAFGSVTWRKNLLEDVDIDGRSLHMHICLLNIVYMHNLL